MPAIPYSQLSYERSRQGGGIPFFFFFMNDLFLKMVPNRSVAPLLENLVRSKFSVGSSLARPCLTVNFRRLLDIGVEGWVALDLQITKWHTGAEWRKGGHSQVTQTIDRAPSVHDGTEG